jgi:carbonic anhydrase
MSKVVNEVIAANEAYVKGFGKKGELAPPPARHFAILTCMDARLDPAKYAGLAEGDAHVIRNAGGRATDDGAFVGDLAQAARHARVVCHSPHELRHGTLFR